MRATSALCLLLLAGCAAAGRDPLPRPGVLRAPTILHINGTFEPVTFKIDSAWTIGRMRPDACETGDRMPTRTYAPGQVAPMPRATTPTTSAPMPNACPVRQQARAQQKVFTRTQPGPKGQQLPAEGEPQR